MRLSYSVFARLDIRFKNSVIPMISATLFGDGVVIGKVEIGVDASFFQHYEDVVKDSFFPVLVLYSVQVIQ